MQQLGDFFKAYVPKKLHWLHGLKVCVSFLVIAFVGFGVYPELSNWEFKAEFGDAFLWAGITVALVLVPGKCL